MAGSILFTTLFTSWIPTRTPHHQGGGPSPLGAQILLNGHEYVRQNVFPMDDPDRRIAHAKFCRCCFCKRLKRYRPMNRNRWLIVFVAVVILAGVMVWFVPGLLPELLPVRAHEYDGRTEYR